MEDLGQERVEPAPGSGRMKLIVIIMLSAAPVIIAAVMYFGNVGVPSSTTNKGHLIIPPVSEDLLGVHPLQQQEATFQQLDGNHKWLILVVGDSPCEAACQQALYISRQVNIALGKNAERVSRLLVTTHQDSGLQSLLPEHPGLVIQDVSQEQVNRMIETVAEHDVLLESYDLLLMDPLGNIMMHYGWRQEGRDLLDDLKRLLKVSKIG